MNRILTFNSQSTSPYPRDGEAFYQFLVNRVYPDGIPERDKYWNMIPEWKAEEIILEIPQDLAEVELCSFVLGSNAKREFSRWAEAIDQGKGSEELTFQENEIYLSKREADLLNRIFWQEVVKLLYTKERQHIHEDYFARYRKGNQSVIISAHDGRPLDDPVEMLMREIRQQVEPNWQDD